MEKETIQEEQYKLPYHWQMKSWHSSTRRYNLRTKVSTELAGNIKGKKVLDVGCGDGRYASELVKRGAKVSGIDFSDRAISFAQEYVPEGKFEVMDALKMKFKTGSFDIVFLMDVIEHLDDSTEHKLIKECKRVLKKGGTIIVSVPSTKLPIFKKHYRHYTPQSFNSLLSEYFNDITITGHLFFKNAFVRLVWRFEGYSLFTLFSRPLVRSCKPENGAYLVARAIKKA